MLISKENTLRILFITVVVLLIPLIAMQFSDEVSWQIGDFIVAGVLLLGSGYLYTILTKLIGHRLNKAIIAVSVLSLLILVWVILAVDLI